MLLSLTFWMRVANAFLSNFEHSEQESCRHFERKILKPLFSTMADPEATPESLRCGEISPSLIS